MNLNILNRIKNPSAYFSKAFIIIFVFVFYCLLYLVINYFPVFNPRLVPPSFIDRAIPVIEWTVWIYISYYALPVLAGVFIDDMHYLDRYAQSLMSACIACAIVFIFFPTEITRYTFKEDGVTGFVVKYLHLLDKPRNCFPSMHIAVSYIAAFTIIRYKKKHGIFLLVWAVMITLSTLTIKQHYIVDVAGGFVIALISLKIFIFRKFNRV